MACVARVWAPPECEMKLLFMKWKVLYESNKKKEIRPEKYDLYEPNTWHLQGFRKHKMEWMQRKKVRIAGSPITGKQTVI